MARANPATASRSAGVAPQIRSTHRPVTTNELVELDSGELVEVGAHTATHPLLQNRPAATQRAEIAESRRYLESVLGRSVDAFAHPFGGRDAETIDTVRDASFDFACTAFPETLCGRSHRYELPLRC